MYNPIEVPEGCHLVEVCRESYGFSIIHKLNDKLLYTSSYEYEMEAMRAASKLSAQLQKDGQSVLLCINSAFP